MTALKYGLHKLPDRGYALPLFIRPGHRDRDAAVVADGLVLTENGDGAHFSDRARDVLQTAIEVVHELAGPKANLHDVRKLVLNANFLDTLTAWSDATDLAGGRAAELAGSFLQMGDKECGAILSTVARSLKWKSAEHAHSVLIQRLPIRMRGKIPCCGGIQWLRRTRSSASLRRARSGSEAGRSFRSAIE